MDGFKKFLLRGNLVELAVAVVIGAAFGALVTALVKDFITPLLAALGGKPDFSDLYFTVNKSKFMYGDFLNAVLSFLIIAVVIYFLVVAPTMRLLTRMAHEEEAAHRDCPECLGEIPVRATRCLHCTTQVTPTT
jgi:large conductance mechanosensitive channel